MTRAMTGFLVYVTSTPDAYDLRLNSHSRLNLIQALIQAIKTGAHELGFAYHVADRVIFLCDGAIYEQGTPQEVLLRPARERTRDFLDGHGRFRLPERQ